MPFSLTLIPRQRSVAVFVNIFSLHRNVVESEGGGGGGGGGVTNTQSTATPRRNNLIGSALLLFGSALFYLLVTSRSTIQVELAQQCEDQLIEILLPPSSREVESPPLCLGFFDHPKGAVQSWWRWMYLDLLAIVSICCHGIQALTTPELPHAQFVVRPCLVNNCSKTEEMSLVDIM